MNIDVAEYLCELVAHKIVCGTGATLIACGETDYTIPSGLHDLGRAEQC